MFLFHLSDYLHFNFLNITQDSQLCVSILYIAVGDFKEKYKTKKKINPSSQTRSVMMEKLRLEYDFYYFAKARFYRLLYIIKKRSIP